MKLTCSVKIKPLAYRTSDLNPIFRLIHSFTGDDGDVNKKRTGRNTDPSCVVDNPIQISNFDFTP